MTLASPQRQREFMENLDDWRHGTKTGYWLAPCHCPKCEAYRDEFNRERREKYWKAREKKQEKAPKKKERTKEVCTVDEVLKPMMGKPSIISTHCVVCGSERNLEQHHPVKRSEGKWYVAGREMRKPTLTLCRDCHEKVHHRGGTLYFKWVVTDGDFWNGNPNCIGEGHWEFLDLSKEQEREWRDSHRLPNGKMPAKIGYMNALEMKGWKRTV